jgi:hypothetical protein
MMHIVVRTSSNLIEPGADINKFSTAEIDDRIFGSKIVLVVEQMQILTIWTIKACLLIMYRRMTLVLPQRRIVIGTAIYVAVGFVRLRLPCPSGLLIMLSGCHGSALLCCMVQAILTVLASSTKALW